MSGEKWSHHCQWLSVNNALSQTENEHIACSVKIKDLFPYPEFLNLEIVKAIKNPLWVKVCISALCSLLKPCYEKMKVLVHNSTVLRPSTKLGFEVILLQNFYKNDHKEMFCRIVFNDQWKTFFNGWYFRFKFLMILSWDTDRNINILLRLLVSKLFR